MTADAFCQECGVGVSWFDDGGYRHPNVTDHDPVLPDLAGPVEAALQTLASKTSLVDARGPSEVKVMGRAGILIVNGEFVGAFPNWLEASRALYLLTNTTGYPVCVLCRMPLLPDQTYIEYMGPEAKSTFVHRSCQGEVERQALEEDELMR